MNLSISITNVRCHKKYQCELSRGLNLIYGQNGTGKTSILETISLIAPGTGLRGAKLVDIISTNEKFFEIGISLDENNINIAYDKITKKVNWNKRKISTSEIIEVIGVGWITPQIIFNFWKDGKIRRNFIDRLVNNFFSNHAYYFTQYEKARTQRSEMIQNEIENDLAHRAVEKILVEFGQKINLNRKKVIEKLNELMTLECEISLGNFIFSDEEWLTQLKKSRKSSFFNGPHNSEINIYRNNLSTLASSTGEQHMTILKILLSSFSLLNQETKILLLDDIVSHLDQKNLNSLVNQIHSANPTYCLLTHHDYLELEKCQFIKL